MLEKTVAVLTKEKEQADVGCVALVMQLAAMQETCEIKLKALQGLYAFGWEKLQERLQTFYSRVGQGKVSSCPNPITLLCL